MLSDLNTIVQFFSALYVTIAIDNMMFNRKKRRGFLSYALCFSFDIFCL